MPLPGRTVLHRGPPELYTPARTWPHRPEDLRAAVAVATQRGIGQHLYGPGYPYPGLIRPGITGDPLREREPPTRPFSWYPMGFYQWLSRGRRPIGRQIMTREAAARLGPGVPTGAPRRGLAGLGALGQAEAPSVEAATRRAIAVSGAVLALGAAGILAAYILRRRLERT